MTAASSRPPDLLPKKVDVVVVGSGAGAIAGAITAARSGLKTIIVEKCPEWGGTTAYSGGGVWVPGNPFQREAGVEDSAEKVLTYLDEIVGDIGPFTSRARKLAFARQGGPMIAMLRDLGFEWLYSPYYPDYYAERPGGLSGRAISPGSIDGRRLGALLPSLRKAINYPPLVFSSKDMRALLAPFRSVRNLLTFGRVLAVSAVWKLRKREPVSMGRALVGQLMAIAQELGVTLHLETEMTGLVEINGRIGAVRVARHGETHIIDVGKAVLIAAGGFARDDAYRRRHQRVGSDYSTAHPGDTGEPIRIAEELGAATAMMDEAWWMPVVLLPDGRRSITVWERAMPHGIIVDQSGQRYFNEAEPYNDAGRRILDRNAAVPSIPSWLIMDARHRANYAFTVLPSRYTPRSWIKSGFIVKASSLNDLADQCGIDPEGLAATIERFNRFAHAGRDEDFGRGDQAFDRGWGDPTVQPNPNLGTIERAPFWAARIWPGDLGTKGGLVTDEFARVVRTDGSPIEGLYATGNSTASVMGRTYPGPGGTLGPAMTFAYIGMRHAAGANEP